VAGLGNRLSDGRYDSQDEADEPPYTEAELEHAASYRAAIPLEHRRLDRREDRCPHTPQCNSVLTCIENIAWFFRYQHAICEAERKHGLE